MEKIESKYQHIEVVDWEKIKESDNRPKMSLQERAKIFLPFSAFICILPTKMVPFSYFGTACCLISVRQNMLPLLVAIAYR